MDTEQWYVVIVTTIIIMTITKCIYAQLNTTDEVSDTKKTLPSTYKMTGLQLGLCPPILFNVLQQRTASWRAPGWSEILHQTDYWHPGNERNHLWTRAEYVYLNAYGDVYLYVYIWVNYNKSLINLKSGLSENMIPVRENSEVVTIYPVIDTLIMR